MNKVGMTVEPLTESNPSVTRWVHELRHGDEVAARRLWEFVGARLIATARREVGQVTPRGYDEDDVAQSAFGALCASVRKGAYSDLAGRGELWQLLSVITLNKARRKARDESRRRRGGGVAHATLTEELCEQAVAPDGDPAVKVIAQDECARLLKLLDRREVRLVALLKVEGYTNTEIARQLGCTRRSVHRRLALIREVWARELS